MFKNSCCFLAFSIIASSGGEAHQAWSQTVPTTDIVTYDVEDFAGSRPASAFEMIAILPGFQIQEGDSDLRGLAGATGNVLVDSQRPTSKQESLETLLRRIPSAQVARIELIRSPAAGHDMQGYAVIANVVRDRSSALSARMEVEYAQSEGGLGAPKVSGQASYSTSRRTIDISGSMYREIDDEHGYGRRTGRSLEDGVTYAARYGQPEGEDVQDLSLVLNQSVFGSDITATALFKKIHEFADIDERASVPTVEASSGTERQDAINRELSLGIERQIGASSQLTFQIFQNNNSTESADLSIEADERSVSRESVDTSESIAKLAVRKATSDWTIDAGVEASLNILDSQNSLQENGQDKFLPAADVRVEEKRAEAFLTASWTPVANVTLEAGSKYEVSELSQTGDNTLTTSLAFLKPRVAINWAVSDNVRISALLEREVGQLDFGDFVSSPSLFTGDVTAGNVNLEPESLVRFAATIERDLGDGGLGMTLRYEDISDAIDHIPVVAGDRSYDAIGNIGDGERAVIEVNMTLPLDDLGIHGGIFEADATWRESRVVDPATGIGRRISDEVPVEIDFAYTHYVDAWNLRLGTELNLSTIERTYEIDEIKTDRLGERLDVFAEYSPGSNWQLRVFGKNLTDSDAGRYRMKFEGLRGASSQIAFDDRVLRSGRVFGVRATRTFP